MLITALASVSQNGNDWTEAFAQATQALRDAGGGTLHVPPGVYPVGPIRLFSDTVLYLEAGATLRFLDDPARFPLMRGEFEGIVSDIHTPCVFAENAQNIRICGDGTLDGNGEAWWAKKRAGTLRAPRPYLVHLRDCRHVRIENIRLTRAPVWTVHPLRCENVTVRGVRIENPYDAPNTDGINPNACRYVRISDCYIDVGDDCIAIKAGTEDTPDPRPCEHILITNCQMAHGHGGIVIGSEMAGGVRNVSISQCTLKDTDRGIRIKTRRGRGGSVRGVQVSGVMMDGVMCPFVINMYYHCGKDGKTQAVRDKAPRPLDAGTPEISDIHIREVVARDITAAAGFFYGLPESPIRGLSLLDITVHMAKGRPGMPAMLDDFAPTEAAGCLLRNARNVTLQNVRVQGAATQAIDADGSVALTPAR